MGDLCTTKVLLTTCTLLGGGGGGLIISGHSLGSSLSRLHLRLGVTAGLKSGELAVLKTKVGGLHGGTK